MMGLAEVMTMLVVILPLAYVTAALVTALPRVKQLGVPNAAAGVAAALLWAVAAVLAFCVAGWYWNMSTTLLAVLAGPV